jgi:hypothetical protein
MEPAPLSRRRTWSVRDGRLAGRPGSGERARPHLALKIETCASSGSITPKIFWSARRWTQEPQLSK